MPSWVVLMVLLLGCIIYLSYSKNPTTISPALILLSFIPILLIVRWFGGKGKNDIRQASWRFLIAVVVAAYYSGGPFLLGEMGVQLTKSWVDLPPKWLRSDFYTVLGFLTALAAIFIALAAQQAAYVNRLQELRHKTQRRAPEITAAYSLVSCGFWAFSCAVPVTLGLAAVYIWEKHTTSYGLYEVVIAILFAGGWILLMAGAFMRFEESRTDACILRPSQKLTIRTTSGLPAGDTQATVLSSHPKNVDIDLEGNGRVNITLRRENE